MLCALGAPQLAVSSNIPHPALNPRQKLRAQDEVLVIASTERNYVWGSNTSTLFHHPQPQS